MSGGVACRATLGGRSLRVVVNAFKHGEATCAWRLPARRDRQRMVRGAIRVHHGDAYARRAFGVNVG